VGGWERWVGVGSGGWRLGGWWVGGVDWLCPEMQVLGGSHRLINRRAFGLCRINSHCVSFVKVEVRFKHAPLFINPKHLVFRRVCTPVTGGEPSVFHLCLAPPLYEAVAASVT
jgi:hypothetical protein